MKKFRFSTLHFIMIGLILFGIIAVLHSLLPEPSTSLMATFVAFLILVLLFIYHVRQQGSGKCHRHGTQKAG